MLKRISCLAVIFVLVDVTGGGFNVDFGRKYKEMAAERLYWDKKYEEARKAFEKLAETAATPEEKSMWTTRAVIALGTPKDKGKRAEAIEKAKSIQPRPYSVLAQMTLMSWNRDNKGLVETFKDEKIAEWPELKTSRRARDPAEDVRARALYLRGTALAAVGDRQAAEQDLTRAVELITGRGLKIDACLALGNNRRALKNEDGALAAYMMVVDPKKGGGGADYYRCLLGAADVLRGKKQFDESLKLIKSMKAHKMKGYWFSAGQNALGETLADAGNTDEAIATFKEVIEEKTSPPHQQAEARLLLGETLANSGKTDEGIAVLEKLKNDETAHKVYRNKATKALKRLRGEPEKPTPKAKK